MSWTPRRPSAALERRLFGSAPVTRPLTPWLQFAPPALAAAALALSLTLHPRLAAQFRLPAGETNVAQASTHSVQNRLTAASFTWTNAALPPSTNASFGGVN